MTDIYELFEQAREGTLPNGFDQWDLADNDGRTVAHHAAWHGHLLVEFDRWGLANNVGWTVAHVAAWNGHLPVGFDQWDLADNSGRTVEEVLRKWHPELLAKYGLGDKE
jgi:hypothetical protein